MSKWIDSKKTAPVANDDVLGFWVKTYKVQVVYLFQGGWYSQRGADERVPPDFWRHLPKPPSRAEIHDA